MPHAGHQYYEDHGGDGFPLVLLHGHTLDHRMWDPLVPQLKARFRVIAPDLAGHGQSGLSPEGDAIADDLAGLLRRLGIERAVICGLSMGGAAAISFALNYPQMCVALICVDAALWGHKFTDWIGSGFYVKKARAEGLAPALEAWLADDIFAPAMASPAAGLIRTMVMDFPGRTWLETTPPPYPAGRPEAERLAEIAAPTLVLVGERDIPDFQRIADRLATEIPGARKLTVAGSGHLLPLERPEALVQALLDFRSQIPPK